MKLVKCNLKHGGPNGTFSTLVKGQECPQSLVKELDSMGYIMSDVEADAFLATQAAAAANAKAAAASTKSADATAKGATAPSPVTKGN